MTKITQNRTIQAPADRVWDILADFGGVHFFHPMVESSPITNGQDTGLGAKRRCELYNGTEVNEEITLFNPERRNLVIAVNAPSPPIETMTGEFTVTPRSDSSCGWAAVARLPYSRRLQAESTLADGSSDPSWAISSSICSAPRFGSQQSEATTRALSAPRASNSR